MYVVLFVAREHPPTRGKGLLNRSRVNNVTEEHSGSVPPLENCGTTFFVDQSSVFHVLCLGAFGVPPPSFPPATGDPRGLA